jgi:hypothetical protein
MKYIIVDNEGIELPIIFNEIMNHKDIAGDKEVISAGFCRFIKYGDVDVSCWGKSISLKKESRGEIDEKIILHTNQFSI